MRYLMLLIVLGLICGCTSTYKQEDLSPPSAKLLNGKSILIASPSDGFYEDHEYPGSGKSTAEAFHSAFARHSNTVVVSDQCKDLTCLKSLPSNPSDYYVVPEILHWEDRATEWSGIKDKLEVKVALYNAKDSKAMCITIISGKSKWMTFGGDHPEDLLSEPVNTFVESLY
jgi:Domain of unknown function (DUF4823)